MKIALEMAQTMRTGKCLVGEEPVLVVQVLGCEGPGQFQGVAADALRSISVLRESRRGRWSRR